ncbi:hypothetical protein K438DRAFT_1968698 [Mycena galopus ATCC 62051]|nr:hypothetical protein K438DRAFT_1968698 [Mycena galopus ATCC 62051]
MDAQDTVAVMQRRNVPQKLTWTASFRATLMAQYDGTLGSLHIGSWFASILYGFAMSKTWEYVDSKKNLQFRKRLLICCMVSCSLAMVGQFTTVYYLTVTFWGNTIAIHKLYWPNPVHVIFNYLTGIMVNAFLIYRLHRVWKKMWITLFLGCCVVLGFVGSIMISVIDILMITDVNTSSVQRERGYQLPAFYHVFIAVAFIWKLCTLKSPFQPTNSLIHRLIIGAIQTSSTTSAVALAMLISTCTIKHSSTVSTALSYPIGPLYVLTLIYNLNLRPYDDVGASGTGTDGSLTHPSLTRPPLTYPSFTNPACTVDTCMDSIHMHRTPTIMLGKEYTGHIWKMSGKSCSPGPVGTSTGSGVVGYSPSRLLRRMDVQRFISCTDHPPQQRSSSSTPSLSSSSDSATSAREPA